MKNLHWRLNWTAIVGPMFLAISCPVQVHADQGVDPRPLFGSDATIIARIEAPLTSIMQDRSETEYRDGRFVYVDANGVEQELSVKLRARGVYRRRKDVCSFAPLRLNFRRKEVADTEFAGQNKLKLVTHCKSRGRYEQYVLKEYLAYRFLETLTEQSLRTRLIQMTYVDTDNKNRESTKYAFVIEEKEELGERLGWELGDVHSVQRDQLEKTQANLIAVFEYFIGNTDFSLLLGARDDVCCHNIILYTATAGTYLPVPYDFDLAGIVNTAYATPNPKYKLDSVKERLYRGQCIDKELLNSTLDQFKQNEQELYGLVDGQDGLHIYRKRQVRRYIDQFYEDFESERAIERNFLKECR